MTMTYQQQFVLDGLAGRAAILEPGRATQSAVLGR